MEDEKKRGKKPYLIRGGIIFGCVVCAVVVAVCLSYITRAAVRPIDGIYEFVTGQTQ